MTIKRPARRLHLVSSKLLAIPRPKPLAVPFSRTRALVEHVHALMILLRENPIHANAIFELTDRLAHREETGHHRAVHK